MKEESIDRLCEHASTENAVFNEEKKYFVIECEYKGSCEHQLSFGVGGYCQKYNKEAL